MLLHVAAVDGRHGGRPARARPAPTLPRQGLGFWRSAPEERAASWRRSGGPNGGVRGRWREALARFPGREWLPRVGKEEEGLSRSRASRGFGVGERRGRTRRKTRVMGLELIRASRQGQGQGGSACARGAETASVGWVESGQLRHGRLGA